VKKQHFMSVNILKDWIFLLKMKNYLLPVIFGSIALISDISAAVALSPVEIGRIAKQVTIQIAGCTQGSGAIVQKNGNIYTVLTVAHGLKSSGCEIVTPDDAKHRVTQIKVFPNQVDLAVVTFTSTKNYPVAKLIDNSDRVEAGEPIYVAGFPVNTAISKSVLTLVKGAVASNSMTIQQPQGYSLTYSNNTLPGHSGGAVWNDRGEVIAIHGQGDVDPKLQTAMNNDVRVKTGYNLGITVNTLIKFAPAAGISGYSPVVIGVRKKPVDDLIASAFLKESKGDYRGMLADLNQAVFLDSQNAQLYYSRGVAKSMLNNRDAIEDYNFAISLNLNEAAVYNNRGLTKFNFGDRQGAMSDYNRAIALDPNHANAYHNRGNAKAALNALKSGLDDLNRAIVLNPLSAQAHLSRGTVKAMLGDNQGELADLNRAIEIEPNYTIAHYQLGLANSKLDNTKGAIDSFNRAITLNPKYPEIYHDRGNARSKSGDNQGAIEDYDQTIAIDPNHAKAYANRGLVKSKLGDKKGAILDLKKAANRFKLQRQTASYQRMLTEIKRIGT
jgi:tetratricopeptide (TPR) repeat protein